MICTSYDHNMPAFEVFLSLSFLFHFFLCMFAKTYTSIAIYEKVLFSLYTYIPIHEKKFLYTHALKNSFTLYRHGLYKTSIPFQIFLFPFSTYTRCLYKNFLYTYSLLTHKNFFSHIVYTQKKISYIFYIQKLFSFLYIQI